GPSLITGVVRHSGHAPTPPSQSSTDEAGALCYGGLCCARRGSLLPPPPTPTPLRAVFPFAGFIPGRPPAPRPRPRGGPPLPPPPSVRSAPHYGGGFLGAAPSGSSRLPWPSPRYSRLGSPLSPHGAGLTPRQASLHAADRTVAPTNVAFDAGLRRRAFPPDAA